VIFVQYGNADACEEKATAIAKATPANNVFMVLSISRLVYGLCRGRTFAAKSIDAIKNPMAM
jgi:hypothetical protein